MNHGTVGEEPIRSGQRWRNKATGRVIVLGQSATGNNHWRTVTGGRHSHRIHEGTLRKFYELLK